MPLDTELTEIKIDRIYDIFMENGFKGGPDEARRIAIEILEMVEAEGSEDVVRQIDKTLDVLYKIELMMNAEAQMNATKHLADVVRPVPLAGSVSSLIGDLESWKKREQG